MTGVAVIPISGEERYEIRGRVGEHRMTENYFTLWDANMGTVNVLNGRTMQVDSDGSYTVTVDAEPANGRPNHVQTSAEAQIAAFADQHFLIEKTERRGRTQTGVRRMEQNERVEEIARMLSGASLTETSRRHAEQMLAQSR